MVNNLSFARAWHGRGRGLCCCCQVLEAGEISTAGLRACCSCCLLNFPSSHAMMIPGSRDRQQCYSWQGLGINRKSTFCLNLFFIWITKKICYRSWYTLAFNDFCASPCLERQVCSQLQLWTLSYTGSSQGRCLQVGSCQHRRIGAELTRLPFIDYK